MKFAISLTILLFSLGFTTLAFAEQCDDGRIPCNNKCPSGSRPACKDSKGVNGKPYCVTPRFCRDSKRGGVSGCDAGWKKRGSKCSSSERTRGCQDKRASNGDLCVRFVR